MTVTTSTPAREILSQFDLTDPAARLVCADALRDAGHDAAADRLLAAPANWAAAAILQTTEEGERVVTVARDGAAVARVRGWSVPTWRTAVYVAARRKADGLLTWRLDYRTGRSTSGKEVSGPMVAEAKAHAEAEGLPYVHHCRHGQACR